MGDTPVPEAVEFDIGIAYDPDAHPTDQEHQALTFAHQRQWLRFVRVTPGKPTERRYLIETAEPHPGSPGRQIARPGGSARKRLLLPADVLPYVTGLADSRGYGHLFPSREVRPPHD